MATKDVSNVPRWSSGTKDPFNKTPTKAQELWNAQNRKTITAARIKKELGTKLKTPSVTRWNSLYDSIKDLFKNLDGRRTQINNICVEQKPCLLVFKKSDKEVIAEYIEIMAPIAVRLDMLQEEKNAYAGVLLPNFLLLKDKIGEMAREVEKFNYAKNLVNYLLKQPKANKGKEKSFEPRFSSIFDDFDLLMATALHPYFKLGVVRRLNEGKYQAAKTKILEEIKCKIASNLTPPH